MKNKDYHKEWSVTFILHSSFFILHSFTLSLFHSSLFTLSLFTFHFSFNLQPFVVAEALVAASDDSLSGL